MASISYPTEKQITTIQEEGYEVVAYENVGIADMEPCAPGKYKNPEVIFIDEDSRIATLYYL